MKKTLVVGLDAACWEYLDPLLEAGQLPALRRLMDAGVSGGLESTLPAWTPTAWASIVTGKNPGKHGVFGMMVRRPGTYEFVPASARDRAGTPFWKRLNERGIRVGLANVPFSYPPDPVEGFAVCGFGTPGSAPGAAYPEEVVSWIDQRYGGLRPTVDAKLYPEDLDGLLKAERAHEARFVRMATELSREYGVEVLVINLMLLDHANHYATDMAQVAEAIREMDVDLAHLLDGFQPDNVLLLSDHGSRRVKGQFLLYDWLLENGYCVNVERPPQEWLAALNHVLLNRLQMAGSLPALAEKAARGLLRASLRRLPGPLTQPIWHWIEGVFPRARRYVRLAHRIDYRRTLVFPESQYSGLIYINLAQREPQGVVAESDREGLAAELRDRLSRIEDPDTGQRIFSGIYSPEELYEGPAVRSAPDLILDGFDAGWGTYSSYEELPDEGLRGGFFLQGGRDLGQHSRDGIFVFSGPDFVQGASPQGGHVMDIAATLLYLYGVPIPEDYDGRVMVETIRPEAVERLPLSWQAGDPANGGSTMPSYTEEEARDVLEHLRALGYVE